jgi:hypothetical protein
MLNSYWDASQWCKIKKIEKNISLAHNIVVRVNGLGFTLCLSAKLFKFILCHVKQCKCKCKNKYTYMILSVKQCKKCDLYLGGGGGVSIMFLVIGQPNGP